MNPSVRLLFIEDSDSDADLIARQLSRSHLDAHIHRSQDLDEVRRLLETESFDLVISDYSLAGFTAVEVLDILNHLDLDLPFIVVSGAVGEDRATEIMRLGASDFVLKDNLSRLVPAIGRELREASGRRALQSAVEQQARTESLLNLVIDLTGDSFWEWDLTTDSLTWSDNFVRLTGESRDDLLGTVGTWKDRIHPDDRLHVDRELGEVLTAGAANWTGTYRFRSGPDRYSTVMTRCFLLCGVTGQPTRMIGAMSDVSERQNLLERQKIFTALADQATESIAVLDPATGRFLEFNRAAHSNLGYTAAEFAQMTVFDIDCGISEEEIKRRLEESAHFEINDLQTRHRTKASTLREVQIRSRPILLGSGRFVTCVWMDVTERKAIEAELRQAQKMDLFGQMAGGIAHDFNNILAAMRLQIELAQPGPALGSDQAETLNSLSQMVDRASNLTRRLLGVGRKASGHPVRIRLNPALDELMEMSQRLLGRKIEIRRIISETGDAAHADPAIHADPSIMDQVFINLFVNARDAMPDGGILTVETSVSEVRPEAGIPQGTWQRREFARIRVKDTGCGMSREVLARLHEPFFTTKEPGRGTGLGMTTVRRSLQEHGGWLSIESMEGVGSTFTIYLPLAREESPVATAGQRASGSQSHSPLVLMVVEDPQMRFLGEKVLRKMGCQVLPAGSTDQAMALWTENRNLLQLAILPTRNPSTKMGGELVRLIQEGTPALNLILTGPKEEALVAADPVRKTSMRRIEMPFNITDLARSVSELIPGCRMDTLQRS
jgi:PAS domain S-box-containing protein